MKLFLSCLLCLLILLAAIPASASNPQPVEKEWTFMVFLNGDNNLDSYGTLDMEEMQKVGSTNQVNIVVLRDTNEDATSSKIYYIDKGKQTMVKDYGSNIDMGDWHTLVDFFKYAKEAG